MSRAHTRERIIGENVVNQKRRKQRTPARMPRCVLCARRVGPDGFPARSVLGVVHELCWDRKWDAEHGTHRVNKASWRW